MPRLTDQEKADILRFVEADKPLPDKYRFLLFDDKREVELVWSGKTNEVCNVVLPFQTIEQIDEPRIEGKSAIDDDLAGGLFDARGRQTKGWTNKLIWGDNKLILSSLKNGPLRDEIENRAASNSSTSIPRSTSAPTSPWTSKSATAATPSPNAPESSKKSPTAIPGERVPTRSFP